MAEKARDPAISVSSGFSKSTETQGTGDLLRTDDFYETVLAMASHDLRQPLQLIINAQELLARRLTASPEREHLERSERASAQLAEQLDLLVDALHLHQSTGRIRPEPVPLQPILERLAQQLDGPARRKGVCLRLLSTHAEVMTHAALICAIWCATRSIIRCPAGVSSSAAAGVERHFASRSGTAGKAFHRTSCRLYSSHFFGSMRHGRTASGSASSSSGGRPNASGIGSRFVRRCTGARVLPS